MGSRNCGTVRTDEKEKESMRQLKLSLSRFTPGWAFACILLFFACTSPSKIEISPLDPILRAAGKSVLLQIKILDSDGNEMSARGLDLAWSTDDTTAVSLTQDGLVTAKASGDANVRVEIVGTDVTANTKVEVQIPFAIRFSKEKIRLITGETVDNLYAEVITSRGAYIAGLVPTFSADDPEVVSVEPQIEPGSRGTRIQLTAKSAGTTQVTARLDNMTASVRTAVFNGDEEINMVGNHISKKKERDARRREKKKEKPQSFAF